MRLLLVLAFSVGLAGLIPVAQSAPEDRPALRAMHFPASLREGKIDINSANAESLSQHLKGVGARKAQAIVDYRQEHGPFRSAKELEQVKGIGPVLVKKNRHLIWIGQ